MNAKKSRFLPCFVPVYPAKQNQTTKQNQDAKARATKFAKQRCGKPQKTGQETIKKAGIIGQSVFRSVILIILIIYQ